MIRLDLQIVANAALGLDLDNGIDRAQLAPQEGQVYLNIVIAVSYTHLYKGCSAARRRVNFYCI